jgi:Uma2 family endonuclease
MAVLRAPAIARKPPASESDLGLRPFTTAEYERMISLGFFEGEHVELLDGMLIELSPQDNPHSSTIIKLTKLLIRLLGDRFALLVQLPLSVSDRSLPEPDFAVVPPGDYDDVRPSNALLVIEVSDSSLRHDRAKAAIYARAGIPTYWIVNLGARTIEVHTSPDGDRYAEMHTLRATDTARVPALDVAFAVADILPRPAAG